MLTLPIEPRLAPDADLAALLDLFCAAAVIADAEPSIHVGDGDDTVCCDFRTPDVGRLREVLQAQVLDDERLGRDIARSTVVTLARMFHQAGPENERRIDGHRACRELAVRTRSARLRGRWRSPCRHAAPPLRASRLGDRPGAGCAACLAMHLAFTPRPAETCGRVDPAGEYRPQRLHHYDPGVRLDALSPG